MKKESEGLELKKSLAQLREGVISLSAMLNKNHRGTLYFGINDDGKVFEVTIGKKTLSDITHEIQTNLKPLPTLVNVTPCTEEGKIIIEVQVEGDDTPYSAYGRYYIRINDADIPMESGQLQRFFEEKESNYSKWEEAETDYGPDDINEDLLIECIRTANEKGRLEYVYRNANEALNKLGLLTENGKLNNAGLYLFGNKKPLTIKEANYPTDDRSEFGEIKEFRGNVFECLSEAVSYIQNHISYRARIVGVQREETPEIPIRAIREIVVNSFAHCSYAKKGDFHQFAIFKSSVRVYNPGPIIKNTDPMKFASGLVGSKIRNILISSTLFKCGYIDAFGTGFDRAFTLCANAGVEYQYRNDDFGFTFVFLRNKDFLNDKINDKINDKMSELDERIVAFLKNNKFMTIPELALATGKSEPTIHRHLESLGAASMIQRIGSRKSGYWQIVE